VHYVVSVGITGFCQNQNAIIANALPNTKINIPDSNQTVLLSDKINDLLNCQGQQNIINILELTYLVNDLENEVTDALNDARNSTKQFNQTSLFDSARGELISFNNASNIDFLKGSNITGVEDQLKLVSAQTYDLSNFGFNETAYQDSLDAVNDITMNLQGYPDYYYDSSNITQLDVNDYPYDQLNSSTQNDLKTKSDTAKQLTTALDDVLQQTANIRGNISDIGSRLDAYTSLLDQKLQLGGLSDQLNDAINDAAQATNWVIEQALQFLNEVEALIQLGVQELISLTACYFVGDTYQNVEKQLCKVLAPALKSLAANMVVCGAVLFAGGVSSALLFFKLSSSEQGGGDQSYD